MFGSFETCFVCFQFLLASLVVLAAARPQEQPQYKTLEDAGILRMENTMNDDGSFQYGFETTDPIQQDVAGQIIQIGEEVGVAMTGSYSYTAEDENGVLQTYKVDWVADQDGFRATGDGIPEDTNAAAQAAAYAAAPAPLRDIGVRFSDSFSSTLVWGYKSVIPVQCHLDSVTVSPG